MPKFKRVFFALSWKVLSVTIMDFSDVLAFMTMFQEGIEISIYYEKNDPFLADHVTYGNTQVARFELFVYNLVVNF